MIKQRSTMLLICLVVILPLAVCLNGYAGGKELKIGTEGAFPPFNFFNEQNQLVGFEIDFAREMAKRMGYEAEFITSEWSGILTSLLAKKYDVIIASMTITPKRAEKVNFSDWYYVDGDITVVRQNNNDINKIADLAGKVVGVTTGTTQETAAKALNKKFPLKEIKLYPSDIEGVSDLINGRLDAFIGAKLQMAYRMKTKNQPLKIVGERLNDSYKGAAFRKDETKLLKDFNMALEQMKQDGSYEKLSNKWFGLNIGKE